MRVIAGSARRIALEVAEQSPTRPFLEMARGALFNSLLRRIPGSAVLDLYAGSGALGIEALSRGAASCVFVECDAAAFKALAANVAKCGFTASARLVRGDASSEAAHLDGLFDLIFLDPPFPDPREWDKNGEGRVLGTHLARILEPSGIAILRIEDDKVAPPTWPGLALEREKRYGRSRICRYRHE